MASSWIIISVTVHAMIPAHRTMRPIGQNEYYQWPTQCPSHSPFTATNLYSTSAISFCYPSQTTHSVANDRCLASLLSSQPEHPDHLGKQCSFGESDVGVNIWFWSASSSFLIVWVSSSLALHFLSIFSLTFVTSTWCPDPLLNPAPLLFL
jgi:hypothetical protein